MGEKNRHIECRRRNWVHAARVQECRKHEFSLLRVSQETIFNGQQLSKKLKGTNLIMALVYNFNLDPKDPFKGDTTAKLSK